MMIRSLVAIIVGSTSSTSRRRGRVDNRVVSDRGTGRRGGRRRSNRSSSRSRCSRECARVDGRADRMTNRMMIHLGSRTRLCHGARRRRHGNVHRRRRLMTWSNHRRRCCLMTWRTAVVVRSCTAAFNRCHTAAICRCCRRRCGC